MNPLSDKQLELNQKFIDLIQEYFWECEDGLDQCDAKGLFKHIWNKGYMLREKDHTIYE